MSSAAPAYTTVIASLCDDTRAAKLQRACESVRAAAGDYDYSIIIVANGARVSPSVLDWLATRSDVRVIRLRTGSQALARRVGAEMATSEFLGFLDDDDELLPDTLALKIAYFRGHPEIDVLVTDGLCVDGASVTKVLPPPDARSADFIEMMMGVGWGACALTLRTQNVDLNAFDPQLRHLEWTLSALQLARRYKFGFLDEPTYRYYADTPGSLSKSDEHCFAPPEIWRRLSKSYAGTRYDRAVRRRYGKACHDASWEHAQRGSMRNAWRLHAESLRSPGGGEFLLFSAKLVWVSLRHLFGRGTAHRRSAGSHG
jgi:glycosyltransferase involved in cell wall biosynthesis